MQEDKFGVKKYITDLLSEEEVPKLLLVLLSNNM